MALNFRHKEFCNTYKYAIERDYVLYNLFLVPQRFEGYKLIRTNGCYLIGITS